MDQFDASDQHALQAASVLGQQFSLDALRDLIDRPSYTCIGPIAHFLVRPQAEGFLFAHALIREGVYNSLLQARRRELHRRAAAWYQARDLVLCAEHLDRADDPRAPRASLEAARAQASDYRYERARALAERGLALAPSSGDCFALGCMLGEILHDLGAVPKSRAAYERALEAATDDHQRPRAWLGLAAAKRITDDLDGAFADLGRAQTAAEQHGLKEELGRIHFLRGNLHFPRGNIEGCLAEHQKSLELALQIGSPKLEAQAFGGLGDADYARGRMISAHRHLERCVELAGQHGFGRVEVANRSQIAHAALYFRPMHEALDAGCAAARAAAAVGHQRAEINARVASVFALFTMVDLSRLKDEAGVVLSLVERLGARRFLQSCLPYVGKAALLEGDRSAAVGILREVLEISYQTDITFIAPSILAALALALNDPSERRQSLAEGEAIIQKACVGHNHLRFYPDAIDVSLALGDWGEAERLLRRWPSSLGPSLCPGPAFSSPGGGLGGHGPRAEGSADAAATPASQE